MNHTKRQFEAQFDAEEHYKENGILVNSENAVALIPPEIDEFGGRNLDQLSDNVNKIEHDETKLATVNLYKFSSDNNSVTVQTEYLEKVARILKTQNLLMNVAKRSKIHSEKKYPVQIMGENGYSCLIAPWN